ncbi:MAG: PilN domain-containing protein [Candidatus Nomurabacteria bacterium]|nr:PilN domain-containing protein [Candidatus Nomurabacteria bacterium]
MDKSFQTSFIPKKPLLQESYVKSEPMSFFSFIAGVLFVGSLLCFGGLYLYKSFLLNQKSVLEKSLLSSRDSFEPETIKVLELFDLKTNISKQLLSSHTVISPFFNTLSSLTIPSVQYTKFGIDVSEKGASVTMTGVALDYQYIALQAQTFNNAKGSYFKNVIFSDLVLKDKKSGNVSFKISFDVDPALLSYERSVSSPESAQPAVNNVIPAKDVPSTDVVAPVSQDIKIDNSQPKTVPPSVQGQSLIIPKKP